jgi:hypothetical protein
MSIENLTIKEVREIAAMLGGKSQIEQHPCVGKKVLAILPGRFIYMGTLEQSGEHYVLRDAKNIRYWKERDNGLGGLAAKGPISGDKIDDCPPVWFRADEEIALMEVTYE